MTRILVAGVAVVDFVFQVDTMPADANKYRARDAMIVGGGCAANAAVAIARHGGEALLTARLGDDPIGGMIIDGLEAENVDVSLADVATGGKSSFSSIYIDKTGERQIMNFRGSGLAQQADWLVDVPPVDAVLADNRWPEMTRRAIEIAQQMKVPCVIDGEAPVEGDPFTGATHVAFSRTGLAAYIGDGELQDSLKAAQGRLDCWACVTDGADGTYWSDGGEVHHIAAPAVEVVDTLGAGDVWHGIFALRLGEGASEVDAVTMANAAAALKCRRFGGREGAPTRAETEVFMGEFM